MRSGGYYLTMNSSERIIMELSAMVWMGSIVDFILAYLHTRLTILKSKYALSYSHNLHNS